MSMAHSFSCDKQGRIQLSEKLLKHAKIAKEAVLLGKLSTFSIYGAQSTRLFKLISRLMWSNKPPFFNVLAFNFYP